MKCPHCGAWNTAYLPKCNGCGAPLTGNIQKQASWEEAMHKKKPSLKIVQYDPEVLDEEYDEENAAFDPESLNTASLTDELEELKSRREEGSRRIEQMKTQAQRVRKSIREAQVIRPLPEADDMPSSYAGDSAAIRRRQQIRQSQYAENLYQEDEFPQYEPSYSEPVNHYGYLNETAERPLAYVDDDPNAPIYYDGYTPDSGDMGAYTDEEYMPRRIQTKAAREEAYESFNSTRRKKNKTLKVFISIAIVLVCCALVGVGGVFAARQFVLKQGMQVREANETRIEITETEADGHPAHTITIFGKENATVYLKEMQSSYVIADGRVSVTVPDYMWYDTESSTYAKAVETDTMDVSITPFIRYSQEGDQYQLDPIEFTVDVPLSPIRLLNPPTAHANVGVSIYEIRINVELGSTVIIDGTNVSTLIRGETGNVSKNVQVLPVGDNIISISVKSKYCRENKMEVVLHRADQEIPLELDATVLVEWNYEPISEEKYAAATDEERALMQIPSIGGTTLPGATVEVDFPHRKLEQNLETGRFTFVPLFSKLGNNDVIIRSSYEGKETSQITHTVYYMPNADLYTRRAWDLDSQYSDLINYIGLRKQQGTIYMGEGVITSIISTMPQMAIMNIGTDTLEKLVMIENSSKTTWNVGTRYKIFGDVYGLYDNMPRLTVRYTYLSE
ncbi:MAG: hypothetical protein IJ381_06820 [Clostridia bacterium]|nr:hypothetical protein [Clostridia bacterium]